VTDDVHARAEQLMLEDLAEPLQAADRGWLGRHLGECPRCAQLAGSTGAALRALRAAPVAMPAGLADRTRLRLYLRAAETRGPSGRWPVWVSCGLSWAFGAASAPWVWRGFEWAGRHIGVSDLVWKLSFGLWWVAPALVSVAIVLAERSGGSTALGREG